MIITVGMPCSFAIVAASSFVIIPPLANSLPLSFAELIISLVICFTSGISFAPGSLGFLSYKPSTSVRIISKSALHSAATIADNVSFSSKSSSCIETVSFALIIGTMPISRSVLNVFITFSFLVLLLITSRVRSTCATV